jgi:hypothetical protein
VIDAARISVMAAMHLIPMDADNPPRIVLPGEDEADFAPTVHECLQQAMQWLDHARQLTIEQASTPPTSVHIITPGGG